jgi:hypothetical protein
MGDTCIHVHTYITGHDGFGASDLEIDTLFLLFLFFFSFGLKG